MTIVMYMLLFMSILGLALVASNPSPSYGALGLVVVAGLGCGLLAMCGGSFLSLILFLIYLGGMLVVFAYSVALASDPAPESLGSLSVLINYMLYLLGITLSGMLFLWGWGGESCVTGEEYTSFALFHADTTGVALMYSMGGMLLVLGAWVLLLTLFVVLELTRGLSRGALRAV